MDSTTWLFIVALLAGIYMSWNIGANDVANAMGTSVGSHSITLKQALIIAAIFEFLGAFLVGEPVTNTIKQGIVDPHVFADPMVFAKGMTAALLASAAWIQFASIKGLPVSTTHSIVGAVVGFGLVAVGTKAVLWGKLAKIFASWIVSPMVGCILAFFLFYFIRRFILDTKDPLIRAQRFAIPMMFILICIIAFAPVSKGVTILFSQESLSTKTIAIIITLLLATSGTLLSVFWTRKSAKAATGRDELLAAAEQSFAGLQIATASLMALAHGSNDVANGIGPVAAVVAITRENAIISSTPVPAWLLALGGASIVVGLATYGKNVMETIGKGITEITPTRGFAAEGATATTVLFASLFGLPLSTTQVLVGSVIGVGLARGIAGLNGYVIAKIIRSWVITIPATALISAIISFIWLKF